MTSMYALLGINGFNLQQESPLRSLVNLSPASMRNGFVANATSAIDLEHNGINAIGSGTLLWRTSEIREETWSNLRFRLWEHAGKVTWIHPRLHFRACGGDHSQADWSVAITLQHDFGYTCYICTNPHARNLQLIDNNPGRLQGPAIFGDTSTGTKPTKPTKSLFPYRITKEVILKM